MLQSCPAGVTTEVKFVGMHHQALTQVETADCSIQFRCFYARLQCCASLFALTVK